MCLMVSFTIILNLICCCNLIFWHLDATFKSLKNLMNLEKDFKITSNEKLASPSISAGQACHYAINIEDEEELRPTSPLEKQITKLQEIQKSLNNLRLNDADEPIKKHLSLEALDARENHYESRYDFSVKTVPIVQLDNVHKTYLLGVEGVAALRGVSLKIHKGEWVAIYGTSGGGKTSLLNIIGTIDRPTKGELKLGSTIISSNTKDEEFAKIRLEKLGFVFQTFNLIGSMTAIENVELPMILKGQLNPTERRARAIASLTRVGMAHRLDQLPNKLSGGEQQRVTIARAIANNPEILLLGI